MTHLSVKEYPLRTKGVCPFRQGPYHRPIVVRCQVEGDR